MNIELYADRRIFLCARPSSAAAATPPPPPPPPPPPVLSWLERCASCTHGLITSSQLAVRDVARTCCQSFCRACIAERFCLAVEDGLRCQICQGKVTSWNIHYLDAQGTLGSAVVFTTPDARRWRIGRRIRERFIQQPDETQQDMFAVQVWGPTRREAGGWAVITDQSVLRRGDSLNAMPDSRTVAIMKLQTYLHSMCFKPAGQIFTAVECRTVQAFEAWARDTHARDSRADWVTRYVRAFITGSANSPSQVEFDQKPPVRRRLVASRLVSDVVQKVWDPRFHGATQDFIAASLSRVNAADSRADFASMGLCASEDRVRRDLSEQLQALWDSGVRWKFPLGDVFYTGRDNIGFRHLASRSAGFKQWHIGVIYPVPRSELVQMAIDGVSILHPQNLRGRPPPADACEMLPSDSDVEYLGRRMTEAHQLASGLHADVRANTEAGVRKIKSLRLQVPHHSREPFVRGGAPPRRLRTVPGARRSSHGPPSHLHAENVRMLLASPTDFGKNDVTRPCHFCVCPRARPSHVSCLMSLVSCPVSLVSCLMSYVLCLMSVWPRRW